MGNGKVRLYKILDGEGRSCNGGDANWSLPERREDGTWQPGEWMEEIEGKLKQCVNGYHLSREQDLLHWLDEAIYEVEHEGELVEGDIKVVVRRCRLTKRCEEWTERSARLFACWCIRNTPIGDGRVTWDLLEDERSRRAVEIAERYAVGDASAEELNAAGAAAWDAARDAAGAAAWDAAGAAAWDAARDAAWDAARDAAGAAARAVQTEELLRILNGRKRR